MKLDSRQKEKPAGVLIDGGTGRRIPFAVWFDAATGEYEALLPAMDGESVLAAEDGMTPLRVHGRAVGKLQLVPFDKAVVLGLVAKPKVVQQAIQPMTADERREGLEQYRRVHQHVWRWRGEAKRCVDQRFIDMVKQSNLFDEYLVR